MQFQDLPGRTVLKLWANYFCVLQHDDQTSKAKLTRWVVHWSWLSAEAWESLSAPAWKNNSSRSSMQLAEPLLV
jgi:hypothetical protein